MSSKKKILSESQKKIILRDMEIQWKDHFHMRDQTWKPLSYTLILFVVGAWVFISNEDPTFCVFIFLAVMITSAFGFFIALHHKKGQKEKFSIIRKEEELLGLVELGIYQTPTNPTLKESLNTNHFIIMMYIIFFFLAMGINIHILAV